ncbi:hypothetical protein OG488_11965 [Streptomyces sp. NBC_01460]|uniref:hypothetical protein n=1 Tax=Streptomyces sp. NBC_01460 TaxID=2903875 RepID=UPI002E2F54D9|nr:hypothetical protein [Streptomyces sp. NBC_01460]
MTADPPLRDSNPCAHTRLPKGNDTEGDEVFLEPDEYAVLRQHVRADALDIVDALVSTGLRWGEITALQPRDFTLVGKRPTLRVQRAWKRRGEGETFLGAPKTKKSRRTLVLTPEQVKLFQRRCLDDVTALSGDQRLPPCVGGRREVLHGVVEVPDQPCHASQLSSGFHQREPVGPDHISRHEGQDLTPLIVNAERTRRLAESHPVQVCKQGMHSGRPWSSRTASGVADANDTGMASLISGERCITPLRGGRTADRSQLCSCPSQFGCSTRRQEVCAVSRCGVTGFDRTGEKEMNS